MSTPAWLAAGMDHIWLPYTQMATANPPLPVVSSSGCRLRLADGREVSTTTASWAQQWGSFAVLSLACLDGLWTTSALVPALDLFEDAESLGALQ